MIVVAVTGGVACGKSRVVSRFLELFPSGAAERFDCDESVGNLLADEEVARKVAALDQRVVVDRETGVLEKHALRKLTFENSEFREKLELLLHPLVLAQAESRIVEFKENARIALIEVPLLYEASFPLERNVDLVVAASPSTQEARLSETRRIEPSLARKIIEAQMPLQEKINRGDIVVWNDGDEVSLEAQVVQLANRCAALFEK